MRRAQQRERPALAQSESPGEGLSRSELIETAREVGLDAGAVEQALVEFDEESALVPVQQELRQLAWRRFSAHLIAYLVGGGVLVLASPLPLASPWLLLPLLLWGVLLLFHLRGTIFPHPDRL